MSNKRELIPIGVTKIIFNNMINVRKRLCDQIKPNQSMTLNFGALITVDSSCLVLLIELVNYAKKHNCNLRFVSIPKNLSILINTYHVNLIIENHIE